MNWEDRIRKSDAGKLMPKRAEEIVKAAKEKQPSDNMDTKVLRSRIS